jgi:hypothetical protein
MLPRAGGGRVGRGGVSGVAGSGQRNGRGAKRLGARHRRRLAARLEGVGRVECLVLDEEAIQADAFAEPTGAQERREAFAERDRGFAGEERQHLAIPPHVRCATEEAVA